MTPRIKNLVGHVLLGAALATAVAVAGPPLLAAHATPAPAASAADRAEVADAASADAIDMNHWHETGHPKLAPAPASPKKPGKIKKNK